MYGRLCAPGFVDMAHVGVYLSVVGHDNTKQNKTKQNKIPLKESGLQLVWKPRYIDSSERFAHQKDGLLCIGARRRGMHPGVLAAWQQPGMALLCTCLACSSCCAELVSAMPGRKGVNTGYTAAAVQECTQGISQ